MSYRDRDEFESKMMEYDYYNNYYEHDYPDYYANDEYDDWEQKDNNNYGGYNNYYEYDQYDFDDYYGNNIGNNYNQYGEEDEEYVDEYDDYDDYEDDFEEFESSDEYEYDDYEESDDYKYDYYYGDCYRMYAAFQCTNRNTGCKETWLSDSVWEYYNRYNYPRYIPQQCPNPKCGRDCYPRKRSMLTYAEYLEEKEHYQQLIDSGVRLQPFNHLRRRYGSYQCRCNRSWQSSWTWTVPFIEMPYYMQDCKVCARQYSRRGRRREYGVWAWKVRPLLQSNDDNRSKDNREPPHDKEGCHYCRYLDKSCAQMFWGQTSKPLD